MRKVKWVLFAVLPVAAAALAYVATRERAPTTEGPAHDHAAAVPAPAKTVMLTAAEEQRIGVTYAIAEMTPLGREIRTVGQVAFDETRVRTLSLKVDGWVEKLYVNFTGQFVAAGAPLLAIYSPMLVTAQEELMLAKRLETEVAGGAPDAKNNAASLASSARRRLAVLELIPGRTGTSATGFVRDSWKSSCRR